MINFLALLLSKSLSPNYIRWKREKKIEGGETNTSQKFKQRGENKNYKDHLKKKLQIPWTRKMKPHFNKTQRGGGNINSFMFHLQESGHESKNYWDRCKNFKIPNHSYKICWNKKKKERNEANFK